MMGMSVKAKKSFTSIGSVPTLERPFWCQNRAFKIEFRLLFGSILYKIKGLPWYDPNDHSNLVLWFTLQKSNDILYCAAVQKIDTFRCHIRTVWGQHHLFTR